MTQLILNIDDPKEARLLRQLITKFTSVTVAKAPRRRKTGLDEALKDVAAGRVYHAVDVDDFFRQLNS